MILVTLLSAAITQQNNIAGWLPSAMCEIYVKGVDVIKGHHNTHEIYELSAIS